MLALVALPLVLAGCGKSQGRNPVAPETKALAEASAASSRTDGNKNGKLGYTKVMFVHASPDAPAVDIRAGKRPVAWKLAFPNSTPYRFLRAGTSDVRVNVAGTSTTVINAPVTFEGRKAYSVFAVNTVANLEPLVLTDDLTRPAAGNAHVRFIHLSPNAPAVDIGVTGVAAPVFPNKSFKDYTPFTPLPAGTYDLEVRVAGTQDVVLPLPGIQLEAGKIYTVFAKGLLGGTGNQALGAQIIVNSDRRNYGDAGRGDDDDDDEDRK
jgi:hypothetical protein